ncbi:MAG TPA: hypothetical protein VK796_08815 [Cytophaga sp.]|nr:hypothetical protein [Cytophaga sp.]
MIRIHSDLRKPYVVLLAYRFLFFVIQSLLFYSIYKNQLDPFFYHQTLITLFDDFKRYPLDLILFLKGSYAEMHINPELKKYFTTEIRAAFFIKVLSPFFLFSANNYYLLGAWLTFFGSLCLVPFLSLFKRTSNMVIWLIVLLIPSFVFWTVGVLKEAFVLPMLFLQIYFLNRMINSKGKDIISMLSFLVCCLLCWYVKYYLAALFLLAIIAYVINRKISYSFNTVLFSILVIAATFAGLGYMHPALQWNVFPEVVYISNQLTCIKYVNAYACIPFDLDMTWNSIILNYPKAITYAFFSPFPWQIHNFTSLLAAIESYVFITLLIYLIYRWAIKKITVSHAELFGLLIILLLGGLLIMASPNIGSFSRYRIFYLPIYAYILLKHSGVIYSTGFLRFKSWIEK